MEALLEPVEMVQDQRLTRAGGVGLPCPRVWGLEASSCIAWRAESPSE